MPPMTPEFPPGADAWPQSASRREFLRLMGASLAMAALAACRRPLELIVPYAQAPEDVVPGRPQYFATSLPFQGYGRGALVASHTGRPTKVEGNPDHPDSLGASDAFMQAATLQLYDPDRSQAVTHAGRIASWGDFLDALAPLVAGFERSRGAGLSLLVESTTSPSLGARLAELGRRWSQARVHVFDPAGRDRVREGARLAFGEDVETHYRVDRASVIVSLDADFLTAMPGSLRYARDFAAGRRPSAMNRLYAVETAPSVAGATADHRLARRPSEIERVARALAAAVGAAGAAAGEGAATAEKAWIDAVSRDLKRAGRAGLVIPGEFQPATVHALAHAVNHALGAARWTAVHTEPVASVAQDSWTSIRALADDMRAGRVEALLVLGANPVYSAPPDVDFAGALARVPFRARLGLYEDETSAACDWHVPEAHPLESWGDLRAFDGTASLVQPLIEPLYGGKTAAEVLSALLDSSPASSHELVRRYWGTRAPRGDFETFWRQALREGVVAGTAAREKTVRLRPVAGRPSAPGAPDVFELAVQPDPTVWDGRWSNSAWLQELPKPVTKLTWENVAQLSPTTAKRLGVDSGDVVEVSVGERRVRAPAWVMPGHADGAATVTLGYGRTKAGRVGDGAGFDAGALRSSRDPWSASGVSLRRTGRRASLAATQHHFTMDGSDLARSATLSAFLADPGVARRRGETPEAGETLYGYSRPRVSPDHAWGMAIDLNSCIGCGVCTIACQAENNIPVVGKEQVLMGREMHWIRVDRYQQGNPERPSWISQPVPCMHCEDAPCEPVCPVGATQHSGEGLNMMVYNRCVGTRYCSNNCPYKVRRFNFFGYTAEVQGPLEMLQNPDVTVRSRGVMEKCTYCVQRIQRVRLDAAESSHPIRDGEIVPACAQACPARAIVFGDLKDRASAVVRAKSDPRDYGILTDLGTRPRTTYQARLTNPNPEIEGAA